MPGRSQSSFTSTILNKLTKELNGKSETDRPTSYLTRTHNGRDRLKLIIQNTLKSFTDTNTSEHVR